MFAKYTFCAWKSSDFTNVFRIEILQFQLYCLHACIFNVENVFSLCFGRINVYTVMKHNNFASETISSFSAHSNQLNDKFVLSYYAIYTIMYKRDE